MLPQYEQEEIIMRNDKLNTPSTPTALTKKFLTKVLEEEYSIPVELISFQVRDADAGVLSRVVMIDVEYLSVATTAEEKKEEVEKMLCRKFVAKFLKPMFPLEHMFRVESNFYRGLAAEDQLSFQTPRPIHTSSSMIMVEHVASDQSYTAVEGCPKHLVIPVITRLGDLHSKYLGLPLEALEKKCQGLASPAGVGSTLSGLAKETQFPGLWEDFLNHIPNIDESVRFQVRMICKELSNRRLRDIHNAIHKHPVQTLIHGDFHVANMLFRKGDVWLVDWATCGKGFPLLDLAFFSIVSLTNLVRKEGKEDMLLAYHRALASSEFSLDDCKQFYRMCILNQFLILVSYDKMSREIAQQAKRPKELTHHFDIVNARACHALIDSFGEDLLPRKKTKEEAAMAPQGECSL